jgi:hypothetical protein
VKGVNDVEIALSSHCGLLRTLHRSSRQLKHDKSRCDEDVLPVTTSSESRHGGDVKVVVTWGWLLEGLYEKGRLGLDILWRV